MTISDFHDYVVGEVLAELDVESKKMFGGYGLYLNSKIFGMISDENTLMFKVDDSNRPDYEAAGSEQFIYEGHKNKKPTGMPYWTVPQEVMEDPKRAAEWALKSASVSK